MNLRQLREAIREESVVKIFSALVTAVNNMADIVGDDGLTGDDAASTLSGLLSQLKTSNDRVSRLDLDQNSWESLSSSMQGIKDAPKTWNAARALITRRMIPEIIASATLVLKDPASAGSRNAVTMLKERILQAQTYLTGTAPVGQAAADAVDEMPEVPPEVQPAAEPAPAEAAPGPEVEAEPKKNKVEPASPEVEPKKNKP